MYVLGIVSDSNIFIRWTLEDINKKQVISKMIMMCIDIAPQTTVLNKV